MYTEKELELAKRYMHGDCNDLQFNYIITTEHMDRDRLEELVDRLSYKEPMENAAKVLLAFMMVHLMACVVISIASYLVT